MAKPAFKPNRIFLVGCPRSGTTLLQCFLGAHPEIATFPETHFFTHLVAQWRSRLAGMPRRDLAGRAGGTMSDLRIRLGISRGGGRERLASFLKEIGRPELVARYPSGLSLKKHAQACLSILDTLAGEQKATAWLDKTPDHLGYIDVIERYAGDCKFIHLIRNGTDVVASLHDANQRFPDDWQARFDTLDKCIARWNHSVELTARHLGKPNHLLVRYENLVEDPEAVLREICAFLDINFDKGMLQDHREVAKRVVLSKEEWKAGASTAVTNANGAKFQQLFTPEQRTYILDHLVAAPGDAAPAHTPAPSEAPAKQYA
jgi:hypothetical protein